MILIWILIKYSPANPDCLSDALKNNSRRFVLRLFFYEYVFYRFSSAC